MILSIDLDANVLQYYFIERNQDKMKVLTYRVCHYENDNNADYMKN